MNAENLDALLIDRALGELKEDVNALLDDYLASNPAAAARAADLLATTRLTRAAVGGPDPQALAPARRPAWICEVRREHFFGEPLRLAAVLAIGLGAGWLLQSSQSARFASVEPRSVAASPMGVTEPAATQFWSTTTLKPTASSVEQRARRTAYRVTWPSLLSMPRFEDHP